MKKVFLESHNIKNTAGGLGAFNLHLIQAISELPLNELQITLNSPKPELLKARFGKTFSYKKYSSLQRHSIFRIREKFDVWHSLNQNISVEPGTRPGKYILTIHDVNFAEEGSPKRREKKMNIFRKKLQRADVITYISEFAKNQTHQYFEVPKVPEVIIYNGNPITEILDTSQFSPKSQPKKKFFYSLGDFIERKNFVSLVRMMDLLPDYELFISGNNDKSYGEEVKNLIVEKGLTNRVFLTGKVSEMEKQWYLQNCEAFLFPSIREGFGLPPIEAMKLGKPVFLSTLTAMPEIGGDAAFYWENFEPNYMKETLLNKLAYFESNRDIHLEKLKNRADFFSWKKAAKQYLELYRS